MSEEQIYHRDNIEFGGYTDLAGNYIVSSLYKKRPFTGLIHNAVVITQQLCNLKMVNFCVSTEESHIKNRNSKDIHDVGIWRPKLITN